MLPAGVPAIRARSATTNSGSDRRLPFDPARPRDARDAKDLSPASEAWLKFLGVTGFTRQAVDAARVAVKIPEARAAGARTLAIAIRQTLTAAPSTRIVDPRSPTFTRFDRYAYRGSTFVGAALGGVQLLSAYPTVQGAVRAHGVRGLYNSREGRTGVIQTVGGGLAVATLGIAAADAWRGGVRGFVPTLLAATSHRLPNSPLVVGAGVASFGLLIGNTALGALDFLNKGETRDTGQVLKDAFDFLPGV